MDLTLREGVSLNDAIVQAKQIDEQSKTAGFYQEALDFIARQGFANACFEADLEDGMDVVDEFYLGGNSEIHSVQAASKAKSKVKINQANDVVPNIQKGLQKSVSVVN